MNHLDLCSGIGGWALAFRELGINTVAFCEIDDYPQKVLKKNFPGIPIFNDLKELTYEQIKERTGTRDIDLVTCSYPCQPFSVAGNKKGEEDSRHLWPDTFRIIQESKPTWFVGENVGGHIKLGLDTVLEDLASIGYDTRTFVIPASSLGAWHQRKRIWIIGHREDVENSNSRGRCRQERAGENNSEGVSGKEQNSNINQTNEGCKSGQSTLSKSHNVGYSEHNGSLASEKSRRNQEAAGRSSQGQNQAEQSEGTSRPRNHENVSDTESLRSGGGSGEECRSPQWQFFQKEQKGCEIRGEAEGCSTSSGEDVSDTSSERSQGHNSKSSIDESQLGQSTHNDDAGGTVSDTSSSRLEEHGYGETEDAIKFTTQENWWQTQSELCGVPDGVSYGLDKGRVGRIKGLGNAIVPQIAWFIGNAIVSAQNIQVAKRFKKS